MDIKKELEELIRIEKEKNRIEFEDMVNEYYFKVMFLFNNRDYNYSITKDYLIECKKKNTLEIINYTTGNNTNNRNITGKYLPDAYFDILIKKIEEVDYFNKVEEEIKKIKEWEKEKELRRKKW